MARTPSRQPLLHSSMNSARLVALGVIWSAVETRESQYSLALALCGGFISGRLWTRAIEF